MRKLNVNATVQAVQILNDSGAMGKIKGILHDHKGEISNEDMTFLFMDIVGGVCGKDVSDRTIKLLAYLFEMDAAAVGEMAVSELVANLKQLAADNDLQVFLKTCTGSPTAEQLTR